MSDRTFEAIADPTIPSPHAGAAAALWKRGIFAALSLIFLCSVGYFGVNHYWLFHTFIEEITIVINFTLAVIVFNTHKKLTDTFIPILGIAYGFTGIFDFLHLIGNHQFGLFTETAPDLELQAWLVARYLDSIGMLTAVMSLTHKISRRRVLAGYFAATVCALVFLLIWKIFPVCFVEGQGLTPFKVYSEYVICLILIVSSVLLKRHQHAFAPKIFQPLMYFFLASVCTEVTLTLFDRKYDWISVIGHLWKLTAFCFLYRAVVVSSLQEPYHALVEAEASVRRAWAHNDEILNSISGAFFSADMDWRITFVNQRARDLIFRQQDVEGKHLMDVLPSVSHFFQQCKPIHPPNGKDGHYEFYSPTLKHWLEVHIFPFENGFSVYVWDIQDRKDAQEHLVAAYRRVYEILERITDGFFALDNTLHFTYMNKAARRVVGKPEVIGKPLAEVFPPNSLFEQKIRETVDQQIATQFEVFSVLNEGWVEVRTYPSQAGVSVYFQDISDRKSREQRDREYHQLLQEQIRLLDLDPDFTFVKDLNDVIVFWNQRAEEGYGFTRDEAVGRAAHSLLQTVFPRPLPEIKEELLRFGRWEGELEHINKNGQKSFVKTCWLIRKDANGESKMIIQMDRDITEERRLKQQMMRLDQLNLVGQMAAGISHEVRNPMTTVRGFIQMFLQKQGFEPYKDVLQLMIDELDRANSIISEFLSIARTHKEKRELGNLKDLVGQLEPLLAADALRSGKNLVCHLNEVPSLLMDRKEIRQVILNLVRNALEVTPLGKTVTMRTYRGEAGQIIFSVQDEGPGIDPRVIDRIGTPFFTTKENGTGLGLAICYGIASRHHAVIDFTTGTGGTVFFVRFPQ